MGRGKKKKGDMNGVWGGQTRAGDGQFDCDCSYVSHAPSEHR